MIAPGIKLDTDAEGTIFGVAGPTVKDSEGKLLILTSREMIEACTELNQKGEPVVYRNGKVIGSRPSLYFADGPDGMSAVNQAAWFTPTAEVLFGEEQSHEVRIADLSQIFSGEVLLADVSGKEIIAAITRANAYAQFEFGKHGARTVNGFFGIAPKEHIADFPQGLSGALVKTRDGQLLGLVVASLEQEALVVPLDAVMAAEGLRIATQQDIAAHNAGIENKDETDQDWQADDETREIYQAIKAINPYEPVSEPDDVERPCSSYRSVAVAA